MKFKVKSRKYYNKQSMVNITMGINRKTRYGTLDNIGKSDYYISILRLMQNYSKENKKMFAVGYKLKKYRKRRNMSQTEFSQFLGISQNYLSEIETGVHVPSLKQLAKISEKMNTTVAKLLG
jgi:DNA-binding XRE family transcriptional regulator